MSTTTVPALDKTFQILDLITDSAQPLTAAHIAKALNLPRSSTHNILQSLLAKHVIYKDSDSRFHLGSYLMYWAGKYEQQQGVIQLFKDLIVSILFYFSIPLPYPSSILVKWCFWLVMKRRRRLALPFALVCAYRQYSLPLVKPCSPPLLWTT